VTLCLQQLKEEEVKGKEWCRGPTVTTHIQSFSHLVPSSILQRQRQKRLKSENFRNNKKEKHLFSATEKHFTQDKKELVLSQHPVKLLTCPFDHTHPTQEGKVEKMVHFCHMARPQ